LAIRQALSFENAARRSSPAPQTVTSGGLEFRVGALEKPWRMSDKNCHEFRRAALYELVWSRPLKERNSSLIRAKSALPAAVLGVSRP
jgi:hypothetical protein